MIAVGLKACKSFGRLMEPPCRFLQQTLADAEQGRPAAEGCTASHKKNQGSQQANKKGHLHVPARPCSPVQMASATPVGFEALGSYPLFTSLKRIPANQLGANADNSHVIGYSVTLDSH
jgi:hypothetical protein